MDRLCDTISTLTNEPVAYCLMVEKGGLVAALTILGRI